MQSTYDISLKQTTMFARFVLIFLAISSILKEQREENPKSSVAVISLYLPCK